MGGGGGGRRQRRIVVVSGHIFFLFATFTASARFSPGMVVLVPTIGIGIGIGVVVGQHRTRIVVVVMFGRIPGRTGTWFQSIVLGYV